ncbi:hypothetical protein FisN_7Lh309 [Fistulifera solaris]|uniref:Uncharacterized protein n=1 Tax=Fistulifera solaris TaxID=1519565 RepID=A0A1Z5JRC2_FISSO|nr:hypothetical protein FisN_7Lh309 [Fistulifera solaris]|eukprot:GAX16580.1 hypothetical protein FisN_7Lh309 [Fistulifera solaris]
MGVQRDLSLLDCSSVSSTVTVDRPKSTTRESTRTVSFDGMANVYHENQMLCSEDCAELWYTAADYKMFKRNTMGMAKTIIQFESQNRAPFSYQRVLEHSFTICKSAVSEHEPFQILSTPSERHHLQRWITAAPNRVGMERWTARSMSKDRQVRRFELAELLLDLQQSQTSEEIIRISCESISRPSRLFAQAMGQASAAALLLV